jgi:hypothetical protein
VSRPVRGVTIGVLWLLVLAGAAANIYASLTGAGTLVQLGSGLLTVFCLGLLILLRLLRRRH